MTQAATVAVLLWALLATLWLPRPAAFRCAHKHRSPLQGFRRVHAKEPQLSEATDRIGPKRRAPVARAVPSRTPSAANDTSRPANHSVADIAEAMRLTRVKLQQWRALSDSGALQRLSAAAATLTDDDVVAFDAAAEALYKQRGLPLLPLASPDAAAAADDSDAERERLLRRLRAKWPTVAAARSAAALFNFFVELRDGPGDPLATADGAQLLRALLGAFARVPRHLRDAATVATWRAQLLRLLAHGRALRFADAAEARAFWEPWARALALHAPLETAAALANATATLPQSAAAADVASLLWALRRWRPLQDAAASSAAAAREAAAARRECSALLRRLVAQLDAVPLEAAHDALRALGAAGCRADAFALARRMAAVAAPREADAACDSDDALDAALATQLPRRRAAPSLRPSAETVALLGAAALGPVVAQATAAAMRELPPGDVAEVALLGRSNAGKSSLANALLRRKQLAAVSATPGHTQAFHFFELTARAHWSAPLLRLDGDGPDGDGDAAPLELRPARRLRLVDAPGLGYAATADGDRRTSWRSLLQRYLRVRRACALALHLVDPRHPLGDVDRQIVRFVVEAQVGRLRDADGAPPLRYALALTKGDKAASPRERRQWRTARAAEVAAAFRDEWRRVAGDETATLLPPPRPPPVVTTSARDLSGVAGVWRLVLDAVDALDAAALDAA